MGHKQTFKEYADRYKPLDMSEQMDIMEDPALSDNQKLLALIRHNSRIITMTVNQWSKTFDDIEDAYGLAILALHKAFARFDYVKYNFGSHCRLYISSALHGRYQKYVSDSMIQYNEDCYQSDYSDDGEVLNDYLKEILTDKEFQFIKDVYTNGKSITEAGINYCNTNSAGASKIHVRILKKLSDKSRNIKDLLQLGEEYGN